MILTSLGQIKPGVLLRNTESGFSLLVLDVKFNFGFARIDYLSRDGLRAYHEIYFMNVKLYELIS